MREPRPGGRRTAASRAWRSAGVSAGPEGPTDAVRCWPARPQPYRRTVSARSPDDNRLFPDHLRHYGRLDPFADSRPQEVLSVQPIAPASRVRAAAGTALLLAAAVLSGSAGAAGATAAPGAAMAAAVAAAGVPGGASCAADIPAVRHIVLFEQG